MRGVRMAVCRVRLAVRGVQMAERGVRTRGVGSMEYPAKRGLTEGYRINSCLANLVARKVSGARYSLVVATRL